MEAARAFILRSAHGLQPAQAFFLRYLRFHRRCRRTGARREREDKRILEGAALDEPERLEKISFGLGRESANDVRRQCPAGKTFAAVSNLIKILFNGVEPRHGRENFISSA